MLVIEVEKDGKIIIVVASTKPIIQWETTAKNLAKINFISLESNTTVANIARPSGMSTPKSSWEIPSDIAS